MGMRKFWSVALPFGKVACVVKGYITVKFREVIGDLLRGLKRATGALAAPGLKRLKLTKRTLKKTPRVFP
jgi:hypothetical protein